MDLKSPVTRHLIPWITTSVFIVMIGLALLQVFRLRSSLMVRAEDQMEDQLASAVANWEDRLHEMLSETLENALHIPNVEQAEKMQARLVEQRRYFQQLHLWTSPTGSVPSGKNQTNWSYPRTEGLELERWDDYHPCLARAKRVVTGAISERPTRLSRMEASCSKEKVYIQMHAMGVAGSLLLNSGDYGHALQVLNQTPKSSKRSGRTGSDPDVSPVRMLVNQFLRAQAMVLGPPDLRLEGADLLRVSIEQLNQMETPNARNVVTEIGDIQLALDQSEDLQKPNVMKRMLARTHRRVAAYDTVQKKLVPQAVSQARLQHHQFTHEVLSSDPFLLFYGWNEEGTRGAALQMTRDPLLKRLLSSNALSHAKGHLVVLNDQGKRVAGSSKAISPSVQVPLGRILPDHRIAIDEHSVQALAAQTNEEWRTPLVMLISVGFLGFVALFLQFRASQQQQMLLNRQRQFTTRVTHELKTPIAGIRLMAENLLSGTYTEAEDIRHCARSIVHESERLQTRIEEVLQLAQERKVPTPQPFDPEESVYAALDQWAPRMETEGVVLEADIALTPMVLGDSLAIRDAVSALLDNALKYRDPKKKVPRVWMSMRDDGRSVSIRVADNGLGVPEDMQEAIFEAFVRVEGPHRGLAGGHGLGLHQVAQIAHHHGGQVTCKTSDQGGALFELLLPAMDVTAEELSLG